MGLNAFCTPARLKYIEADGHAHSNVTAQNEVKEQYDAGAFDGTFTGEDEDLRSEEELVELIDIVKEAIHEHSSRGEQEHVDEATALLQELEAELQDVRDASEAAVASAEAAQSSSSRSVSGTCLPTHCSVPAASYCGQRIVIVIVFPNLVFFFSFRLELVLAIHQTTTHSQSLTWTRMVVCPAKNTGWCMVVHELPRPPELLCVLHSHVVRSVMLLCHCQSILLFQPSDLNHDGVLTRNEFRGPQVDVPVNEHQIVYLNASPCAREPFSDSSHQSIPYSCWVVGQRRRRARRFRGFGC